jgi:high affinity Mn2+ porin
LIIWRWGFGAFMRRPLLASIALAGIALIALARASVAADPAPVLAVKAPPPAPSAYDWTGFHVGGHFGYAWGSSNWTTPPVAGSFDLFKPFDAFSGNGSYFGGIQIGYDTMLPNRFVLGVEADASFPSFPNLNGISVGGTSAFVSPFGPESLSETVVYSGTVRGRIGYAPGNWLFYATGGLAWTYDQLTLTQRCYRHDRHAVFVAIGLGGRRRRRSPDSAALDCAARIPVHRLR